MSTNSNDDNDSNNHYHNFQQMIEMALQNNNQYQQPLLALPTHIWILLMFTDILGLVYLIVELAKHDQIISVGLILGMIYIIPVTCVMFFHAPRLSEPGQIFYLHPKTNVYPSGHFSKEIIYSAQIIVMILLICTAFIPDTVAYANRRKLNDNWICWTGELRNGIPFGPASCQKHCEDMYESICGRCTGKISCPDIYVGTLGEVSPFGVVILIFAFPVLILCCIQCIVHDWNPNAMRTYTHNMTTCGFFALRLGGTLLLPLVFLHRWFPVLFIVLGGSIGFIVFILPLTVGYWIYARISALMFTDLSSGTATSIIELRVDPQELVVRSNGVELATVETQPTSPVMWAISVPNNSMNNQWQALPNTRHNVTMYGNSVTGEVISEKEFNIRKQKQQDNDVVVPRAVAVDLL
jgi:hypothetical protein